MAPNQDRAAALVSLLSLMAVGAGEGGIMAQCRLDIITNCLISANIPFELSFVPGTRRDTRALQLTVHINPKSTLSIQII